jgi:hypothetical protein
MTGKKGMGLSFFSNWPICRLRASPEDVRDECFARRLSVPCKLVGNLLLRYALGVVGMISIELGLIVGLTPGLSSIPDQGDDDPSEPDQGTDQGSDHRLVVLQEGGTVRARLTAHGFRHR